MESKTYALVVKGLSRLPVTEEIAGSNPVERATKIRPPFGERIFVSSADLNISDLLHPAGDEVPVHHVPPGAYVIVALVLVIQVIGMLPYIESE